jgi:glycerol-3-phosphate dehydrogenase (NAD(P)+)
MNITVLGAGSFGTTVATLVSKKHRTLLWARHDEVAKEINELHVNSGYLPGFVLPDELRATSDLEEAASHADLLIVGVPTRGFRAVLQQAAPSIRPWIPVVSLSKGLEADSLLRMSQVIKQVLPGRPACVLTGPNIAKEIMAGFAAASVIATEDLSVAAEVQSVLGRGRFRVYTNHDVIGCEIAGALKNVIAIAAGVAQGLSVGDNTRAAVICRGLAELTWLGIAMGGEAATFAGLAGVGDLIATCVSPHSRNRFVGEQLGLGRSLDDILAGMNMVAEGVKTAETVMKLADQYGVEMPICREIHLLVTNRQSPADAYAGLTPLKTFARLPQPGHESDPG